MSLDGSLILAIDLGTSGPKVGLVRVDGQVVSWDHQPVTTTHVGELGAEQDPDEWWRAIVAATGNVLHRAGPSTGAIRAVTCTAQWSGTVPVDHDGRPLGPALIWLDGRGRDVMPDLIGGPVTVDGYAPLKALIWLRYAGGAPTRSGKDPVAHIRWFQQTRPAVCARTRVFLEPKDYLNFRLTGLAAAGHDSIALHWVTDNRRIDAVRYHPRLLSMAGLDRAKLPDLRSSTDVLGPLTPEAADELGVDRGLPVVVGAPDVHSAAIGAGAVADFDAHLYLGTSSWLVCHVPFKKTSITANMASLPSGVPGRWLLLNEQESAGACLRFLGHGVGVVPPGLTADSDADLLYPGYDAMTERCDPGADGVVFAPWLHGERTPVENSDLRGSFVNLSLTTTPDDMVRAVMEGVALNTRWLLDHVERFTRRRIDDIRVIGGAARSDVWCRIHADVLDRNLYRPAGPHLANLRGSARLGFAGLGLADIDQPLNRLDDLEHFAPCPETRELYDRRFETYLDLYRATRRFHRRLRRRTGPFTRGPTRR